MHWLNNQLINKSILVIRADDVVCRRGYCDQFDTIYVCLCVYVCGVGCCRCVC